MIAQAKPPGLLSGRLANFRLIPRLETYPKVVAFAQTAPGKVAILAAFALGQRYFLPAFSSTLPLTLIFSLITFMPEYRRFILAIAPIIFLVLETYRDPALLGLNLAVIDSVAAAEDEAMKSGVMAKLANGYEFSGRYSAVKTRLD